MPNKTPAQPTMLSTNRPVKGAISTPTIPIKANKPISAEL